jgi:hypothetical protein
MGWVADKNITMNIFWSKYYPWIRKGLYISIFACIPLNYYTDINFPKSLLITLIILFCLLEMASLYLTTDLD